MNRNLERRVTEQLVEIERMSGLKRFLAPRNRSDLQGHQVFDADVGEICGEIDRSYL